MTDAFDAYHLWLAIPPEEQPPHHYRLLGVKIFEPNAEVLASAADQRMLHVRTFQTGKNAAASQKLLNELSAARLCLLNPEKRQAYDRQLRERLALAKASRAQRPIAAKTIPVAKPLTGTASSPSVPKGIDLPEQTRSKRVSKARSARPTQTILAIAGAAVVALIGFGWLAMGSGGGRVDEPAPLAAHAEPAPSIAVGNNPAGERAGGGHLPHEDEHEPSGTDSRTLAVDQSPVASADDVQLVQLNEKAQNTSPSTIATPEDDDAPAADFNAAVDIHSANDHEEVDDSTDATDANAPDARLAPPDAAQLATATAEIERVFPDEYATAKKSATKSALAEKLAGMARETADATEKFALLSEARRLATGAGNSEVALRAAQDLAESFAVNRFNLSAETAEELAARDLTRPSREKLVQVLMGLVNEAPAAQQFAAGRRLAEVGLASARKVDQPAAAKAFAQQVQKLTAGEKLALTADKARAIIKQNPDDPKANETLGTYLCLMVGDWNGGLPHLRQSDNSALRAVAELELAADKSPVVALKIGDAWWDLSERNEADADSMRGRAAIWYRQATGLKGLSKSRVEKRLQDFGSKAAEANNGVTATKIVIWNSHNGHNADRGMLSCNLELRRAGKVVWSKADLPLAWSRTAEPATPIRLPKVLFDTVRIETVKFHEFGAALCEVEVFQGKTNLASGKPVTSSGSQNAHTSGAAVVDGIKNSSKEGEGYWAAPDHQPAWIEIQIAPPAGK